MAFKHMDNEAAVSPIVATLVLIVVAVVGAVAVGTIMGTFSSDVSEQANAGDVASASSAEILIAGSTTVQPASEVLAKTYMEAHPGVKISVQGGGSGAGIAAANNGLVDIGSASKAVDTVNDYPDLTCYTIGGSAVVVIAGEDVTVTEVNATELYNAYHSGTAIGNAVTFYERAEDSGTEETFAKFLTDGDKKSIDAIGANADHVKGATGNAGVIAAVQGDATSIGFVDFGYADAAGMDILNITVDDYEYEATGDTIEESLSGTDNDNSKTYVKDLTRPLNYLVKGTPSSIVKDYISYCQSPGAMEDIESVGYIPYVNFA